MKGEVDIGNAALEVLAASPTVTLFKGKQPDDAVDPFWQLLAARARDGLTIHALNREDAGKAFIHAAAELPVERFLLSGEEIMRLAEACADLQATNAYFHSSADLSELLTRDNLDVDDVVVAVDLRADPLESLPNLEQTLLLTRLASYLQRSPERLAILAMDVDHAG